MNDSHDLFPEDSDERMLADLLTSVKRVEPSLEARIAVRGALAAELSRLAISNQNRRMPWWQRTISVPWPIAVSAAALLLAVPALQLRAPQAAVPSTGNAVSTDQPAAPSAIAPRERPQVAVHTPEVSPEFEDYQTQTYLCGIGPLNSSSKSFLREDRR